MLLTQRLLILTCTNTTLVHRKIPESSATCQAHRNISFSDVYSTPRYQHRGRNSGPSTTTISSIPRHLCSKKSSCTPSLASHWRVSYYFASLQAQNFPAHKPRDLRIPSAQAMTHVAWSCDGKRLAAVGIDKVTRVWTPETSVSKRVCVASCILLLTSSSDGVQSRDSFLRRSLGRCRPRLVEPNPPRIILYV